MKLKAIILLLCISLSMIPCLYLCSCSADIPCAEDILNAVMSAEVGLPAGRVYLSRADRGDVAYASDNLICSLYGGGSTPPERKGWIEFAIFLSTGEIPCELAVFLCSTPTAASDTAKMLCARLDTLRHELDNSLYKSRLDGGEVTIIKNICLMLISSDTANAKKTAMSVI